VEKDTSSKGTSGVEVLVGVSVGEGVFVVEGNKVGVRVYSVVAVGGIFVDVGIGVAVGRV
jgi:hypothetical protein